MMALLNRCHSPFKSRMLHLIENAENPWSVSFLSPFDEIEHIADIAFIVRGETLLELHYHAFIALSFYDPELLKYKHKLLKTKSLDEIIINLNSLVSVVDAKQGCTFKAISYHGEISENNGILTWEMIIDV